MGNTDADHTNFSNDISPTDVDTQFIPHVFNSSINPSSMTTSGADATKSGEIEKKSEAETRPEMQAHTYMSPPDKIIPRHPLPLIIPRASANTSQSPEQSPSLSNVSFPMSPSLPSSRPPAAPTPTPISATQTAPHPLLQSLLATTDAVDGDSLQPTPTPGTATELISPNPQPNSPSSQIEPSASREGSGNLTKRNSGGKSKQSAIKDTHDGSRDAAAPSVHLPPSSKTPLINTKPRPPKQSPSGYDSSLLSLLFCCTRTGPPSPRSSQQPQPLPVTNSTTTSDPPSSTSNSSAGRVPDHGNTGSALGTLARFLPTMPRKGKENGKEMKSKQDGKEQARLLHKPSNSRKVAATDVQNANGARSENRGTGKIESSSPTSGSSRDPTANLITSVSPGKQPTTVVRRRSSVFGHHGRPGKTMLKPLDAEDIGKKCLVLDLDETLVHSSFKMITQADFVVPVEIESAVHNVYVLKRPGVDTFLKKMGELFEIVVFTASLAKYADPVLDMLDKHKVVKHRLFRESCYNHKGNYVKDLSQLGRDIRSVIIIDNSPTSYIFHPTNAVPITSWFNDPLDTELIDLMPFLEDLTMVENVTVVLDQGG